MSQRFIHNDLEPIDSSSKIKVSKLIKHLQKHSNHALDQVLVHETDARHPQWNVYAGDAGIALLLLKLIDTTKSIQSIRTSKEQMTAMSSIWPIHQTQLKHLKEMAGMFVDRSLYSSALHQETAPMRVGSMVCTDVGPLIISILFELVVAERLPLSDIQALLNLTALPEHTPAELFYGRAGYISGLLCIKELLLTREQEYQKDVILFAQLDDCIEDHCKCIMSEGRHNARMESSIMPLTWKWHKEYFGAAHGICGILYVLLQAREYLSQQDLLDIGRSIEILISIQHAHGGDLPVSISAVKNHDSDYLVQLCHGAPGLLLLLSQAIDVYPDQRDRYLNSAAKISQIIWDRGLSRKGVGLCHGISGNVVILLKFYKATGIKKYLDRALAMADFMTHWSQLTEQGQMRVPDHPWSLFEGLAGAVECWREIFEILCVVHG